MATAGGHWKTLAECQKLTQSTLLPGVIETDIKRGNPIEKVPVAQAANTGLSIKWNLEKTTVESAVGSASVGAQTVWSEDVEYDQAEASLKITYVQRKLDKYVESMYGNIQNYELQALKEIRKGVIRKLGDLFIYGDTSYGSANEFDGIHALAGDQTDTTNLNIDMGSAPLSIHTLRLLLDAMKYGVDEIWVGPEIGRRLDEAYEEAGFARLKYDTAGALVNLTKSMDELGRPVLKFNGIPIVRTDFLVAEQADTCLTGTSKRAKYSSGTKNYSLFAVKYGVGSLTDADPGLKFAFGNTDVQGGFFTLEYFEKLETFIGRGMRLYNFGTVLLGSGLCLGRIADITDANVVY